MPFKKVFVKFYGFTKYVSLVNQTCTYAYNSISLIDRTCIYIYTYAHACACARVHTRSFKYKENKSNLVNQTGVVLCHVIWYSIPDYMVSGKCNK